MIKCPDYLQPISINFVVLKPYLLFILLFIQLSVYAQDTATYHRKNGKDYKRSDYVEDLTRYINITPFIYASSNTFSVNGRKEVKFQPNEGNNIGLRFNHRWIGLALTFSPKNSQAANKGNTKYINLQLNGYGKKIGFDVYYNNYKGFYIQNYKSLEPLKIEYGKSYPLRPDLQTTSTGFNTYYIFNYKKYSYRASFIQNEWQKRSAGSFLLNGSFSYYRLKADSALVPRELSMDITSKSAYIKQGEFYSLSILPGYAFTAVLLQHVYFTLSTSIGVTGQWQRFASDSIANPIRDFVFAPRSLSRVGLGFNSKRFYMGIAGMFDIYNIPVNNTERLTYQIGNANLYVGYRIHVPKFAQPVSDFIGKVGELPKKVFN